MSNTVIIAGGKTGGHLFPGIAVAQALQRKSPSVDVVFVGTDAPFERSTLKQYGYTHKAISSRPLKGKNILSKAVSLIFLLVSLLQALGVMMRIRPGFVIGVGGFSSFAVVLSAWIFRIPTAIQEQNAYPGLTNRLLSRFAKTIFTSFENTRGFKENPKTQYVGNPVRYAGQAEESTAETAQVDLPGFDPEKFTLLVTGGSQGAQSINTAFLAAVELMADSALEYNIIHQTGRAAETDMQQAYREMNIPASAQAFYHDMPKLQELADLIITRAGAGTLSELCAKGKPAVLVPYPHAADDHQTFNAKALADNGAGILIPDRELDGPVLKKTIEALRGDLPRLEKMSKQMKQLAMPDADIKIAGHILNTMNLEG